jgi:hypothetical protein
MSQLHFDFYSTRKEFVRAAIEQFIRMAPKFTLKKK